MKVTVRAPDWATQLLTDFDDMGRNPTPIAGDGPRESTFDLPDDAYFEYAFADEDGRVRADPDREARAHNPWYAEVSKIEGPDYQPHPLADIQEDVWKDHLTRERLTADDVGQRRVLRFEHPEAQRGDPVLIVQDGTAYARIAHLLAVHQALIDAGRSRPAHALFIDPSAPAARRDEYGFGEGFTTFMETVLLPAADAWFGDQGPRHLLGASLGGLMSTYLATRNPGHVDGLAVQSPAYLGTPARREFYGFEGSWFKTWLDENEQPLPWRVHHSIGRFDWLLDVNREVAARWSSQVLDHHYVEANAGHNWTQWRNVLPAALESLLPPAGAP
jgi:enterochelin esterase family protein